MSIKNCPSQLQYQFTKEFSLCLSDKCCLKMKKEPIHKWEKEKNKSIAITGMRADEGGMRTQLTCIITDDNGKIKKFHPLVKVDDEWEKWFGDKLEKEKEKRIFCKLYYEPFNFKRTGCKGCPFSLDLQEQLETMSLLMPNERTQCEFIWKPVYDEYRRINYRLKRVEKIKLF